MGTFEQAALSILQRAYNDRWNIWLVGTSAWHARPIGGDDLPALVADTPERIVELVAAADQRAAARILSNIN